MPVLQDTIMTVLAMGCKKIIMPQDCIDTVEVLVKRAASVQTTPDEGETHTSNFALFH